MGLKTIGVSAILKFSAGAAVSAMSTASDGFDRLNVSAKKSQTAMQAAGAVWNNLTRVGMAVGAGAGFSVKAFADFDQAAQALRSRLTGITDTEFERFTNAALDLGKKTKFTAAEILGAMEGMSKFGISQKSILGEIGTVAKLATVENVSMAKATEMMLTATSSLGLPVSRANEVLNTMAYTAGNTAATIPRLVQGLKLSGSAVQLLDSSGMQAIKVLGLLNDNALFGTTAGTAFASAMIRIARSQKQGAVQLGQYRFKIEEMVDPLTGRKGVDLIHTLLNAATAMGNIKNPSERAAAAMKLFGMRGARGAGAFIKFFRGLDTAKLDKLFKKEVPKDFVDELFRIRDKNIKNDWIKLTSAVNTLGISMARNFKGKISGSLHSATKLVGGFAESFDYFLKDTKRLDDPLAAMDLARLHKISLGVALFTQGLILGFRDIGRAASYVWGQIKGFMEFFGIATSNVDPQFWGRLAGRIAGVGTALAGLAIGVKLIGLLGGGLAAIGVAKLAALAGGIWLVYKAFKAIDSLFGVSDWLAGIFYKYKSGTRIAAAQMANQMRIDEETLKDIPRYLAFLRSKGVTKVNRGGQKVELTREFAESRIREKLRKRGIVDEGMINRRLQKYAPQLMQLPSEKPGAAPTTPYNAKDRQRRQAVITAGASMSAASNEVLPAWQQVGYAMSQMKGQMNNWWQSQFAVQQGPPQQITVVTKINEREIGRATAQVQKDLKDRGMPSKGVGPNRAAALGAVVPSGL